MDDLFLLVSGIGGILIALFHGYLGHAFVLRGMTAEKPVLSRVNAAVFQLSTIYWIAAGALLVLTPALFSGSERRLTVGFVIFAYGCGAIGNFWATRGRHPGWALLGVVIILAMLGQ
ncbi:MAG: hypothetical protein AAFN63_05835 [Pseudomonadota bacterium]